MLMIPLLLPLLFLPLLSSSASLINEDGFVFTWGDNPLVLAVKEHDLSAVQEVFKDPKNVKNEARTGWNLPAFELACCLGDAQDSTIALGGEQNKNLGQLCRPCRTVYPA